MTAADDWDELFLEWGHDHDGNPLPCSVETLISRGSMGDKFKPAAARPGLPQMPGERMVRSSGGNELLSTARIYAPTDMAADFTPGSRVTLANGRKTVVLSVEDHDVVDLFAFVKVNLE